jgi:hypothetical protein
MLYVGAKVMLYSPRKATASAAASLCSLVCDCYRVLTTAHRVVRAELTSTTTRYRRGLGTLHIPNTLSAMLWEPCTLVASICWLLSHLHCTVDAGTLALRVMGTGQGDGGR